jgi:hypothetical protein
MSEVCRLEDFLKVMAVLQAGTQKMASPQTIKVYHRCLSDLPFDVLLRAAELSLLQHEYATIPSIALLRKLATEQPTSRLTALEALDLARRAINHAGGSYASADQRQAALNHIPSEVAECLRAFGWDRICDSDQPEVLNGQWRRQWEESQARGDRQRLIPPRLGGGTRPAIDASQFGRIE